jgi:hypothetical protein
MCSSVSSYLWRIATGYSGSTKDDRIELKLHHLIASYFLAYAGNSQHQ